jgi:hypothetical protein
MKTNLAPAPRENFTEVSDGGSVEPAAGHLAQGGNSKTNLVSRAFSVRKGQVGREFSVRKGQVGRALSVRKGQVVREFSVRKG